MKFHGAVGLATCIVGGIKYVGDHRVKSCFLEEEIWARRIVWKRLCQEYQKAEITCHCPVSSSSVVS